MMTPETDRAPVVALLMLFLAWVVVFQIVPPLQSYDEADHVERAYLAGKGSILLDNMPGQSSGGMIDTGLLTYIASFDPHLSDLFSPVQLRSAAGIRWTGLTRYDPAPGTGYYFPAIYAPQFAALMTGESLGLTVEQSYQMARAAAMVTALVLLLAANTIYPLNPFVLALLSMPMCLPQFSGASIDGTSTGLAILAMAAFLRLASDGTQAPRWLAPSMALAVGIVAACRLHALPLLILLYVGCKATGRKSNLAVFMATVLFVAGWTVLAARATTDFRFRAPVPVSEIIFYYLHQPMALFEVLQNTFTDGQTVMGYGISLIGGLNFFFYPVVYSVFAGLLIAIAGVLYLAPRVHAGSLPWLLLLAALLSTAIVFASMLLFASPHPAHSIRGVQGRYFLLPLLLVAFALSASRATGRRERLEAWSAWYVLLVVSLGITTMATLIAYHISPFHRAIQHQITPPGP